MRLAWVRQLLESQRSSADATDLLSDIKSDLLPEEVFAFTPRGDVINLPAGATAIDFAYAIHSAVGNRMIGAKVNNRIVPIDHKVQTGEIIEIITGSENRGPSRDWLNIVKTSEAKNKIRNWFKKERREENIQEGRDALEREMRRNLMTLTDEQHDVFMEALARRNRCNSVEEMYAAIGYGGLQISRMLPKLKEEYTKLQATEPKPVTVELKRMHSSDGVIVEGASTLNTAALTGESLPRDVRSGDEVISGCVNMSGLLKVRTTKEFGESTVSKILDLVENSSMKKARAENFITRFARVYTPAVCYGALALAFLPPVVLLLMGQPARFGEWVYRALTFLVISCPCALVISIPLSFFGGIGGASSCGILIKGSTYLEELASTGVVVFDKTGTLTRATPQVVQVVPFSGCGEQEVLQLAACLEEHFPHSMATAVVRAARERGISHEEMHSEVEYIVAHGIASRVGGTRVVIGSAHFIFEDEGCTIPAGEQAKFDALDPQYSHLYLAASGVLAGVICIADPLRPEAAQVLHKLRKLGIAQTVMMTGDSDRTARAIAAQVGVDRCFAEVLPEDKAAFVRDAKAEGHTVVMIGDGINDSPALSAADIGIAIHSGAAIAREIADVTIRADSLEELVTLKAIANALQKRVGSNYRFVLSFNSALILLGALGILPPATSAMLHNLSTLGISLRSMTDLLEQKNEG